MGRASGGVKAKAGPKCWYDWRMKLIAVLVLVAACATPYQRKGFRGGYSDQQIGPGRYLISVDGNGFTSRSTIVEYQYRRASELCPMGFDVLDADRSTSSSLATFDGGKTYNTVNKPSGSLAVRCRATPVAAPGAVSDDRKCTKPTTPIVSLKNPITGSITGGFSDDDILNAAAQFLITSGTDLESKDLSTHTIVTKWFTGQTIQGDCPINEYRAYAFRIAVANGIMIVGLECQRSSGWEPHWKSGVYLQRHRSPVESCGANPYISQVDATLQPNVIKGTQALLDLHRPATPPVRYD
jgi:hypothetical protein